MMSTVTPRPPLPRWVWITLAAVIAAAVVVGIVLWAQRPTGDDVGPTTSATPQPTGTGTDVVTGCLAEGQGIDMLLATQENAAHTEAGAVEFATADFRWLKRSPWPSAEEYMAAIPRTWAGKGGFDQAQYDQLVSSGNASNGIVPEGTPFHLTSVIGRWYVDEYTGDTAQVTVGLAYVIGEAVSPLYKSVLTYNLVWTKDGWASVGTDTKHTVQELFDDGLGTPYAGGC